MNRFDKKRPLGARIVILSEHPVISAGIRAFVESERKLVLAAELRNAADARAYLAKGKADLLLLDLSPPTNLCFTLLHDFRDISPALRILVLSTEHESLYAERAVRAGARGYVMEQAGGEAILNAMRQVLSGQLYLSPAVSQRLLQKATAHCRHSSSEPWDVLTEREFDIFQLIGHGKSSAEIAAQLHLSPKTVAVHRNHIRHKLNLKTGAELIRFSMHFCETQPFAASRAAVTRSRSRLQRSHRS